MATVIQEVFPSQEQPVVTNSVNATRHFRVYDDVTPSNFSTAAQVIALFGTGLMPTYGSAHPSIAGMVSVDYVNLRPIPESRYVWTLTWNYLRTTFSSSTTPTTPGYWEYNYRSIVEVADAWRDNPGLNFPATGTPIAGMDIGGVSIDSAGEPGSAFRIQQIVDITEVIQGAVTPATAIAFLKKRNNNTFLGAQAGRLVYAGQTSSGRIGPGLFQITSSLIWDEWYHMRQKPSRTSDREVALKIQDGDWVADRVLWTQPFPSLANFDNISAVW